MTKEEIIKELDSRRDKNSRYTSGYFCSKFSKNEKKPFWRRSFLALFNFFRVRGVSEKELLEALIDGGYRSICCPDAKKIVFFHMFNEPQKLKTYKHKDNFEYFTKSHNMKTKYNEEYLDSLLNKILNENNTVPSV